MGLRGLPSAASLVCCCVIAVCTAGLIDHNASAPTPAEDGKAGAVFKPAADDIKGSLLDIQHYLYASYAAYCIPSNLADWSCSWYSQLAREGPLIPLSKPRGVYREHRECTSLQGLDL
jgi:hypothetical protein